MDTKDKYRILEHFESILESQEFKSNLTWRPEELVSTLWEELYIEMPLCDPDDTSPESVIAILRKAYGDSLRTEESCGLFSIIRLTLPNNICYLQRCPGGYYILPVYRSVRRFHTRLQVRDAADLIMEIDRHAPMIMKRIEDMILERKLKTMTMNLIKATCTGVIKKLKKSKQISVPDIYTISGTSLSEIHICFQGCKVLHCPLEKLEATLLKKYPFKEEK